ncbi:MAG: RNA polymerase sigma factor [Pseudomonadota bacterium]
MCGDTSDDERRREQALVLRAVQDADGAAFELLVAPYVARIQRYLASLVRQPADADDLTQDVLMQAWRQLHKFDGSGRFRGWIFAIAHRAFLQHARGKRRYWRALTGLRAEPVAQAVADNAAVAELDIHTLLSSLDADSRAVILLSRGMGLTHGEIAQATGKPLGTVKSLVSRATRRLVHEQ